MTTIRIESIRDAVNKGTLMELAGDYRTSSTIRACLPRQSSYPFAISTAAYRQEVQPGTARDRQSRMEVIGTFLSRVLGLGDKRSPADLRLTFPGGVDHPTHCSLKLEWFAPNGYWVFLLPNEQLQSVLKLA